MFTVTCAALAAAARRWLNAAAAAAAASPELAAAEEEEAVRREEGEGERGGHVITLAPSDAGRPARKGRSESRESNFARPCGNLPRKVK